MSGEVKKTISGDCFATGDILGTAKYKGEQSGTGLLGKLVELPIFFDYIKETHHVGDIGIPLALLLGTEWWDFDINNTGKGSYFDFLTRKHKSLRRKELDALNPEPARPDILTCNGPNYSLDELSFSMDRNEYYEIKPDSRTGMEAWFGTVDDYKKGKKYKLAKFYRDFALPYKTGTKYPANSSATKHIPLPLNRVFKYLASLFIRRNGIKRLLLYISVRRHEPGLLLYKICVEIETDDKRKQQTLAKAAAKHMYATYVVSHFPEKFQSVEEELGDYSFEGDKFPKVRCKFNVIPELKVLQKSLEETITMRGIALPGEEYVICCDEVFYQSLVAKPQVDQVALIWAQIQSKAETWVKYAGGSVAWSKVQPLFLEVERVARYIKLMYPDAQEFANLILNWVSAHPYLTVGLIVTTFVFTASVAAFVEAGLLAAAVSTEVTVAEAGTQVVGGLGRIAMSESVAAPIFTQEIATGSAVRGLITAEQVAAQIGGTGAAANDLAILGNAVARPLLSAAVAKTAAMGVAAAFVLMVNSSTAYAQDKDKKSGVVNAKASPIIGQHASRLFMARALPEDSRPVQGSLINLRNFAEPLAKTEPSFSPPPPLYTRYLGRVVIS